MEALLYQENRKERIRKYLSLLNQQIVILAI